MAAVGALDGSADDAADGVVAEAVAKLVAIDESSDMILLPLPELPGQVLTVLEFPRSQPLRAPAVITY